MNATTKLMVVGIDLAKDVFQLHWVDPETGEIQRKKMSRSKLKNFFVNRQPCLIGMEACGGAHYWAREFIKLGHEVKLMPGVDVKAFNQGNKSDARDAEAIWLATQVNSPRKVAVKTEEQQAILALHRIREVKIKQRTATINQLRGLLSEFGFVMPKGHRALREGLKEVLPQFEKLVPKMLLIRITDQWEEVDRLTAQIKSIEKDLATWSQTNPDSERLREVPGVGLITATAVVATIGDAKAFKNGRQLAAFLGVAPAHTGSGGKIQILGMSKRGDTYVRKLLIHGARSVVCFCKKPPSIVERLKSKRHVNVVTGAIANRLCRIMWSLMKHQTKYNDNYEHILSRVTHNFSEASAH